MDYEKKYKELTSGNFRCFEDISSEYPDCGMFEKCVIGLRKLGWTYSQIQIKLGMPSKKTIRKVLLQWNPELIDNSPKKDIKISNIESELYNILAHTDKIEFESDVEYVKLWIQDHEIWFEDEFGCSGKFHNLDTRTQNSYLLLVKNTLT